MKKKTLVKIKEGRVIPKNKESLKLLIESFEGAEVLLSLENLYSGRSNPQNNLYWLYLDVISEETGEPDTLGLHEVFKRKFLFRGMKTVLNKEVPVFASTTELDITEFTKYIDSIELLTEIPIPDTEEWRKIKSSNM
tara:strand:+ start:1145 stop:1555 length:411 start_codon:yes stop_codon:yes gene_type:complete